MSAPGATRPTSLLSTDQGALEYLTTGTGDPSTVFGHGLAGSIDTTRPFGALVPGRRTYLHFRGHGASSSPETPWTYRALGAELRAVADHVGARQAFGVSMGAGAICAVWEQQPDRFDRAVLALPAVVDAPRTDAALERLLAMAALADDRDTEGVTELLLLEQPAEHRDETAVRDWCARQARVIVHTDVSRALRTIPHQAPLTDRAGLSGVRAPVLLLAQEADPAHPVWVAQELARVLPAAELVVLPPGGILWSHRARVRALIGDFLAADPA